MNYPLKNWENVLDAHEIEQEDENEVFLNKQV